MFAGRRRDQLLGDPYPITGFPHTAFEHITHAKLSLHLAHVNGLALVGEGRVAGDDEQSARFRQQGDDVFGDAVSEIFLFGIAAHVGEWQHGDRRLVGERKDGRAFGRRGFGRGVTRGETSPANPNWPSNIFEALVAHVLECEVEPPGSVFLNPSRDANPARVGQTFQTGCDIHAITEDVVALDYDIADIDANPESDAIVGCAGITLGHRPLPFGGAPQGIYHAGEFNQKAVTCGFDDPAPVFANLWID